MADLPVAPDWATWAQGGYLPPDGSAMGPAAVGPGGGYVPPNAMPSPLQAGQAGTMLRSFGHAIMPALVDAPATAAATDAPRPVGPQQMPPVAPPVAPPAAPPPPPPAAPQAPQSASLPVPPVPPAAPPAAPQTAQRPAPPAAPIPPPMAPQMAPPQTQTIDPFAAMNQPSSGSKRGNYYASAIPPQGPLANVLQQSAQKYGVPLQVATWVGYHESGWNPNAVGIPTSSGRAQGMWQFMPGTAQQYGLQNPNDPVASTDAAMHKLSDLAQHNGGDWEKAVQQYGTFSTGQGQAQDNAARNGFREWMGMAPQQDQPAPPPSMQPGSPAAVGDAIRSINLPYGPDQTTVPPGYKLLALASGILSGKNLGEGLGKGLAAMAQFEQQDVANKRATNAQALQIQQIGALNKYRAQMAALAGVRANTGQVNAGAHVQSVNQAGQLGAERVEQGAARTGAYVENSGNRYNVPLQAQLAGAKASASGTAKENVEDIDNMLEAGANAPAREMQIQQLQSILPQAGTGPGLASIKRGIANYFGVDLTPYGGPNASSAQLAAAIQSQLRGSGIMGKNMRTQREFNTVMEGLPNMDQNPQTATAIINGLKNYNDYNQQAAKDFLALPQSQRSSMRGDQDAFQQWRLQQVNQWRQRVQQNGGMYGQPNASAPAPQQQSAAPTPNQVGGTTSSGVTWKLQ